MPRLLSFQKENYQTPTAFFRLRRFNSLQTWIGLTDWKRKCFSSVEAKLFCGIQIKFLSNSVLALKALATVAKCLEKAFAISFISVIVLPFTSIIDVVVVEVSFVGYIFFIAEQNFSAESTFSRNSSLLYLALLLLTRLFTLFLLCLYVDQSNSVFERRALRRSWSMIFLFEFLREPWTKPSFYTLLNKRRMLVYALC